MPRRSSTTSVPAASKSNVPKRKKTRALNALAIAERQTPIQPKLRSNRLEEIEKGLIKPKNRDERDDLELGQEPKMVKGKRALKHRAENEVEVSDDSDSNTWVNGQVDSNDDSDIDSNMAMEEGDEDIFEGFTFRGSSTTTAPKINSARSVESKLEDIGTENTEMPGRRDEEEFSDDLGEEAIDLVALVDSTKKNSRAKGLRTRTFEGDNQRDYFGLITDESIFDTGSSAGAEESTLSVSDDEGESTKSANLESLKALVSRTNTRSSNISRHHNSIGDTHGSAKPSEFGLISTKKLTIVDLFPSITDPNLKRSLKLLAKNEILSTKRKHMPAKLKVSLTRRERDRLDRAAAYDKSKETLNRWIETVKHNRRAEHLSFPLQYPDGVSARGKQRFLPNIEPRQFTDLESAIQKILVDSGLAPVRPVSDNDRALGDLPTKQLSLEEFQAREAELRRARELLFREERRARRMKKIKSKSYRRVHRKERERNAQREKNALLAAGFDNSESEQERSHRRRAEERMGARHRESKWARGVKDSGRAAWDEENRIGITEMARRGQELRRRMDGKEAVAEEDFSIASNPASEDDTEEEDLKTIINMDISHQKAHASGFGIKSNLPSLNFMKKAEALRKARNDTKEQLLRRQSATEPAESGSEIDDPGRRSYGPGNTQSPWVKGLDTREQRNEVEVEVGLDYENESFHGFAQEDGQGILPEDAHAEEQSVSRNKSNVPREIANFNDESGHNLILNSTGNLWLTNNESSSVTSRSAQDAQRTVMVSSNLIVEDVAAHPDKTEPVSMTRLETTRKAPKTVQHLERSSLAQICGSADGDEVSNMPMTFMRNQDLVREAFAGDEVVADFIEEKEGIMREEEEKTIDATLPGWGTWTGAGITGKQKRRNHSKVHIKVDGIPKRNRQDGKLDRVIINEKRIRKVSNATERETLVL